MSDYERGTSACGRHRRTPTCCDGIGDSTAPLDRHAAVATTLAAGAHPQATTPGPRERAVERHAWHQCKSESVYQTVYFASKGIQKAKHTPSETALSNNIAACRCVRRNCVADVPLVQMRVCSGAA